MASNSSERKLLFNCFLQFPSRRHFTATNCFSCKCLHTARLQVQIDILKEKGRALLGLIQPHHRVLGGFSLLAVSKFNSAIITGCWPVHSSGKWHQHFPEVQQKIVQGISQQARHFEMNLGCNDHNFQLIFFQGEGFLLAVHSPVNSLKAQESVVTNFTLCEGTRHPHFAMKYYIVRAWLQQA